MDKKIIDYLASLKKYGTENDIPNVTEEVGRFLNLMIKIKRPKNILEIGCANGYSTIWMSEAIYKAKAKAKDISVKIHSIDHSKPTFEEAKKNLVEIELDPYVQFYFGDAVKVISDFPSDLMFDFVFIDGEKRSYLNFWNVIQPRLNSRAVIIFDDMMAFPEKTKEFSKAIKSVTGFGQMLLPIDGNDGILLLVKQPE